MFAYLGAIASGHYPLIFLAGILMSDVVYSAQNGVWPALYGEMFPTRVRLSGTANGTQIGFAIGGFMPTVAAAIDGNGPDGWPPVAALVPRDEPDRGHRHRHGTRDIRQDPARDRSAAGPRRRTRGGRREPCPRQGMAG
jgi:hypothetical protein